MRARSERGRLGVLAVGVAVMSALIGGCATTSDHSDGSRASTPSPTTSRPSTTTLTPTTVDPGHLVPAAPGPTTLPTEDPVTPVRQDFDTGQQVVIAKSGFEPKRLSASIGEPVVWTNDSGVTQTVTVVGLSVHSPLIPPGAQFVWTPNFGGSIAYRSGSGFQALLILQ